MTERTSLGALLKRYRLGAGFSQEALAARAKMSARAISDVERGVHRVPHADTLDRLAGALALGAQPRALLFAAAYSDLSALPPSAPAPLEPRLPLPPTALIGRESERARAVTALTRDHMRLLTITGPGGVGKTRLALEVARDCASEFADGMAYVEFAAVRDAALVPTAIAHAVGLREQAEAAITDQLAAFLGQRRMLLVLDNFEHLLPAAPMVAELLARCPALAVLVTSRAPLRVRAEQTLALGPLPLEEAVVLFRERAQTVWPDSEYANADIAGICERVDRLPLAIELAAAQVRALSVPQLLQHLTTRLPLLGHGASDLPERQRTMADAIAWSYALLTPSRQRCFRALGVFAGGWTLDAARATGWGAGTDAANEAILSLAELVDTSLIQVEAPAGGVPRFSMLDLVREFALDRLRAEGEADRLRRQHAEYYADLAETAASLGPGQGTASAHLAAELPNARAALEWAAEYDEAEIGLRLAGFGRLWHLRGAMAEAIAWQEGMLALDAHARERGRPAAPLALRNRRLYGFARTLLGAGDLARAEPLAARAAELARLTGDEDGISNACATLGMIAQASGNLDAAEAAYTESCAHAPAADHASLHAQALVHLAELRRLRGDMAHAESLLQEALAMARAGGDAWDTAIVAGLLGRLMQQRHGHAQARVHFQDALKAFLAFGSSTYIAWCLEALALTLCAEARYADATHLAAVAAGLRERAHTPLPPVEREAFERMLIAARGALGELPFAAIWAAGMSLTQESAVAAALAVLPSHPSSTPKPQVH
ncbi:MAG TPA: helix-turn-helix domain-containing protein [Ktedonobacterales bacterium]